MIDALRRKGAPNVDLMPAGGGLMLAEFGADDAATADAMAQRLIETREAVAGAAEHPAVYERGGQGGLEDPRGRAARRDIRAGRAPPRYEGWDDSAVPPPKLGGYLRDLRRLLDEYNYQAVYYGHFGHGCIHMQVSFDLRSEPGIRKYGEFVERAADLVVQYGGSVSGEHGDGQSRGALLPKMFGPELMEGLREFKRIWDPGNKLNPHKLIDAYQPTENLRLGADYKPLDPPTHFKFPDDDGSFARTALALHRRRRVPQARLRHHVPQLHGDARGNAQHARPRPHVLRGAAGRGHRRRVEQRAGQGVTRPLPLLQGMQVGVPGQRGHRHVSLRVPVALLRVARPAARGLRVRDGRSLGPARVARSAPRQLHEQRARRQRADPPRAAPGAGTRDAAPRDGEFPAPGRHASGAHRRASARRRSVPSAT